MGFIGTIPKELSCYIGFLSLFIVQNWGLYLQNEDIGLMG